MCCPHWWSRVSRSSSWSNLVTLQESWASLIKWKKPRTHRYLDPSDHMSHSKVLPSIFTPLALPVFQHLFSILWQPVPIRHGVNPLVCKHQLCVCCCTSGLPKAALVDQNRLLSALVVISAYGVKSKDVMYVNLPLYHTAGFLVGFLGCMETGGNTKKVTNMGRVLFNWL